jgi:uncharacterized protein YpuA (DUF1002 family)
MNMMKMRMMMVMVIVMMMITITYENNLCDATVAPQKTLGTFAR